MSLASSRRTILPREFRLLLAAALFGLVFVPAIGSLYYREDIGIGYRQFLSGLFDPETSLAAIGFVLAPYLLMQLVRCACWVWRTVHPVEGSVSSP